MTLWSHCHAKAGVSRMRGAARHSVQDSKTKRTWREWCGPNDQTSPQGPKGRKKREGRRGGKGGKGLVLVTR